jgi:hypothetical protein
MVAVPRNRTETLRESSAAGRGPAGEPSVCAHVRSVRRQFLPQRWPVPRLMTSHVARHATARAIVPCGAGATEAELLPGSTCYTISVVTGDVRFAGRSLGLPRGHRTRPLRASGRCGRRREAFAPLILTGRAAHAQMSGFPAIRASSRPAAARRSAAGRDPRCLNTVNRSLVYACDGDVQAPTRT